jgi:signal transduction histidine kinase
MELPALRALRGETLKNYLIRIERPDKTTFASVNCSPILHLNGEIESAIMCLRDITEKHQVEIELKKKNKLLEMIIHNVSNGIFIFNKDGKLHMTNEEASGLVYPADSLTAIMDSFATTEYFYEDGSIVPMGEIPTYRAFKGEIISGERITVKQPNRELVLEIKSLPIYDEDGNIDMVITSTHDITDMMQKNKAIQEQKELLEIVVNSLKESICVIDKNGKIMVRKSAAAGIQQDTEYAMGSLNSIENRYNLDGTLISSEEFVTNRAKCGKETINSIFYHERNGEKHYYLANGKPIFDKNDNILYGVTTTLEVTDLIKNQQDLEKAKVQLLNKEREKNEALEKAMQLKDEFLYLITHEFKTPISVINSALQVVEVICKDEVTIRVAKYLNTVKVNTNRQLRLVNNLLDITKVSSGHIKLNKSRFDIAYITRIIVNSIEVYAKQKKIDLIFTSSIKSKMIYMDEEKYERIILNLLSNAIKFTPHGKQITVSLTVKRYKDVRVVSISVCDEGIGIPEDKQEVIFERFGQVDNSLSRRAEGTGLGLHLVKQLIDAMGAEIMLKSKPDKGSTFTVLLPLTESIAFEEAALSCDDSNQLISIDKRIIQSAAIEFSDIYFG